ncbi:MAG: hypothetical protein E3J43_06630 [Candidatus Heimdallarchaeota archaeon]|nr:MAG: hypothetical protein E3J43_06630 [Candidatus Heimdallarchaeota archaeon]
MVTQDDVKGWYWSLAPDYRKFLGTNYENWKKKDYLQRQYITLWTFLAEHYQNAIKLFVASKKPPDIPPETPDTIDDDSSEDSSDVDTDGTAYPDDTSSQTPADDDYPPDDKTGGDKTDDTMDGKSTPDDKTDFDLDTENPLDADLQKRKRIVMLIIAMAVLGIGLIL